MLKPSAFELHTNVVMYFSDPLPTQMEMWLAEGQMQVTTAHVFGDRYRKVGYSAAARDSSTGYSGKPNSLIF